MSSSWSSLAYSIPGLHTKSLFHVAAFKLPVASLWQIKPRRSAEVNFAKRIIWKNEPLVKEKATKRAMNVIKMLSTIPSDDEAKILEVLNTWVKSMNPKRRDLLDILKEFRKRDQKLLIKLLEWSLDEEWFEPCTRDYIKLLREYIIQGFTMDAKKLFSEMENKGYPPDIVAFTIMIRMFGKSGNVQEAQNLFDKAKLLGFDLDVEAYTALMVAYSHVGLPEKGEQILNELERFGKKGNTESFMVLINGYGRKMEVNNAQRVFDLMVIKGVRPDAKCFIALMDAYGRAGQPQRSREVFYNFMGVGFVPDDRVILLMIQAYQTMDMLEEAFDFLLQLESCGRKPGAESLTELACWLSASGLMEEAEGILKEMIYRGFKVPFKVYNNIYNGYLETGCLEKASEVHQIIDERHILSERVTIGSI